MYMRTTVAGLLVASTLLAGEVDPKAQAKTVWSEALKQGDAWTCLQLESWARDRKPAVRLGSALGDSAVVGEVRFALPAYVTHICDLGERVVMATAERAWVAAPDGRPVQPSVRLRPVGGWQQTGYGGKVIGTVRRVRHDGKVALEFGAVALADGRPQLETRLELTPVQHWGEELALSYDGKAFATIVVTEDGAERRRTRNVAIAAEKKTWIVGECREPYGIGPAGAWLLARGLGDVGPLLVRGDKRTPIIAGAAGPGIAACIIKDKALLIREDGSEAPLTDAPALGSSAGMVTVGSWLVLASGYGAKVISEGDLLGENAGGMTEQPSTLALWRWADLAANPAAKPAAFIQGDLSPAYDRAAALWVWKEAGLDLVDLTGEAPVRSRYLDAPAPIRWATSDMHCLRLEFDKPQRFALYGPDKAELWSGEAQDVQVKRRDVALTTHRKDGRPSWRLQWLSADAGKRRSVTVAMPVEADDLQVAVYQPDLVLGRGPNRAWWSAGFDGKAIASGDADGGPPRPDCPEWSWFAPTGRYYREGARVYEKALGTPADAMQRLQLADAWRAGGSVMLLETDGRVQVSGRKRGEWLDLGAAEGAQRFGLRGPVPVLVRDEAKVVATMASGPKLLPGDNSTALEIPLGGPWRLADEMRFTPPRGRQLQWDGERVGWGEVKLRSPDGAGMFIVTASALIELDPDAARMFGK